MSHLFESLIMSHIKRVILENKQKNLNYSFLLLIRVLYQQVIKLNYD